ncbi:MAG: hypothetical protein GYB36_09415 [Alphaproteobacteria bacterium]|nr:hypothetical protein [Alphaproteobacteria bacterium]
MLEPISFIGVIALAVWLTLVGVIMALTPEWALHLLRHAASTLLVHVIEMTVRFFFGMALILASKATLYPQAVFYIGFFLTVSSVLILVLPRRWHAAYAVWWADRLPAGVVRVFAVFAFVGGALILYVSQNILCALNLFCA